MARKVKDITNAKTKLAKLEMRIRKNEALGANSATEIEQCNKDIAANIKARKEADAMRAKEHEEFLTMKAETEKAINSLGRATRVLNGAGMGKKSLVSVARDLQSVINLPSGSVHHSDLVAVRQFVADPAEFYQSNRVNDYNPASTNIQGILKNMFDTAATNLETSSQEEAESQEAHEKWTKEKVQEHQDLEKRLLAEKAANAKAVKTLAESKADRINTKAELKDDTSFLQEVKKASRARADEWAERTRLRTEELASFAEARDILQKGEATFADATAFVQLPADLKSRVYGELKTAAVSAHSTRIAQIAAMVQVGGHFDRVIAMIDRMIKVLRDEESQDITDRDACNAQETLNQSRATSLADETSRLESEKRAADDDIQGIEKDIDDTNSEIDDHKKKMKDALDNRNDEHNTYVKDRKDDQTSVILLTKAIAALTKFYEKNKIKPALVQEEPTYAKDEDAMPAGFKKPYKGRRESRGIVGLLRLIRDDLKQELKKTEQQEAEAVAEYQKMTNLAEAKLDLMQKKVVSLNSDKAEVEEHRAGILGEKTDAEDEAAAVKNAKENLKPSCDWVKTNFETRRAARKLEMDGLFQAKASLATFTEEAPAASLLQRK